MLVQLSCFTNKQAGEAGYQWQVVFKSIIRVKQMIRFFHIPLSGLISLNNTWITSASSAVTTVSRRCAGRGGEATHTSASLTKGSDAASETQQNFQLSLRVKKIKNKRRKRLT